MKLLQWNIWYKEKIENIVKVIQELDPDILCLQELTADSDSNTGLHTAEYIRDTLNMRMFYKDAHIWKNPASDVKEVGNGIFSKYPIACGSYSVIHQATDDSPDFALQSRIYIEADLKLSDNNYLCVGTAHLTGTPGQTELPIKTQETDLLMKQIRKNTSKYIFTGDLNSVPDSRTLSLVSGILKNAGPDLNELTWPTKPFEQGEVNIPELKYRFDYVFTTPDISVTSSQIIKTEFSDHLPILVEFELT